MVMIILGVMGAGLGSFACCQAWRLRKHDKSPRSHCMNCEYQLKWYDNLPIISWLILGGKCRKCRKKIGCAEIFAEVLMAAVFVLSFAFWPWRNALTSGNALEIGKFCVFLIEMTVFMILAVYDAKWKEMPTSILLVSIGIGVVFWAMNLIAEGFSWEAVGQFGASILILPGFYYFMYCASKEQWVGAGDAMLCIPLAMMLGKFWLALFCLFGSNIIGSAVMLPVLAVKRKKHAQIPFGPFLILGFLVVFFLQDAVIKFMSF